VVEALCYMREVRGFNFLGLGVLSARNRNEYQKQKKVSGE
jgi:hypothetical protein